MDWFERLTGFREAGYDETRARLAVDGDRLRSLVNGKSYGIGQLELVSLADLRSRASCRKDASVPTQVGIVVGDVRRMHHQPGNAGALFQVASQFNLLEMVRPGVTPEQGVTRYQSDRTQGPACAIAAGAATIYRYYLVPVGGDHGQTASRQLDGLSDMGSALAAAVNKPVSTLWQMKNGYALCTRDGLQSITANINEQNESGIDSLRARLRIGFHRDVEVTDADGSERSLVSQAFCSALPVAYTNIPSQVGSRSQGSCSRLPMKRRCCAEFS